MEIVPQLCAMQTSKVRCMFQCVGGGLNIETVSVTFAQIKEHINNKEFLCITHTVEHNYISPSSTVGIQLHVSALYVGHLQVVI